MLKRLITIVVLLNFVYSGIIFTEQDDSAVSDEDVVNPIRNLQKELNFDDKDESDQLIDFEQPNPEQTVKDTKKQKLSDKKYLGLSPKSAGCIAGTAGLAVVVSAYVWKARGRPYFSNVSFEESLRAFKAHNDLPDHTFMDVSIKVAYQYIQKITINKSVDGFSPIIVIGSLCGQVQAFNDILKKIEQLGYLNSAGHLLQNAYLVLLGDYANSLTSEKDKANVLKIVLQLKNMNPGNVFALAGEGDSILGAYDGFPKEVFFKTNNGALIQFGKAANFDPENTLPRVLPGCTSWVFIKDGILNALLSKDGLNFTRLDYSPEIRVRRNAYSHYDKQTQVFYLFKEYQAGLVSSGAVQNECFCLIQGDKAAQFGCELYDSIQAGDVDAHTELSNYKTTTIPAKEPISNSGGYTAREIRQIGAHWCPFYVLSSTQGCFAILNLNNNPRENSMEIYEKNV